MIRTNNEQCNLKIYENRDLPDGSSADRRSQAVMLRLAEGLAVTRLCQSLQQAAYANSTKHTEHEACSSTSVLQRSEILSGIRGESRGASQMARARQRAMYLAHVAGGMSLTSVGAGFGRDRTTVRHACALWEDARDNKDIDVALACEEVSLQAMAEMLGFASAAHSRNTSI